MSVVINALFFVGIAAAGLMGEAPPEVPDHIMATMVELPRLGDVPPDPKALPRMVKTPPPPPEQTSEVSLSRELEEELEKKEKEKKRKLEKKKKREEDRKKRIEERKKKREERRERKRALRDVMADIDDPRADVEDAPGFEKGHKSGTSTDPNTLRNKMQYLTRVSLVLSRQFEAPAGIEPAVRRTLSTQVFFRIDRHGKVKGNPRIIQSSGNGFFDEAALRTVRRFGPGSELKIPLPSDKKLRRSVIAEGLQPKMKSTK
mgnify:CR=1 FL=1